MDSTPPHSGKTGPFRILSVWTIASWLLTVPLLSFVWVGLTDPELYARVSHKDDLESTGIIEHLTVIVLLPGIATAIYTLIRFRRGFPSALHAGWLLMWTLACIYFAGEECSWGQWYFGFETPEVLENINKQDEFNLHNTTSWLNQRPRAAVELFIVTLGLLVPVMARFPGIRPLQRLRVWAVRSWPAWVLALPMCWAAAAYFILIRLLNWAATSEAPTVDAELRELAVAWFLSLYLFSYLPRLRAAPPSHPVGEAP